MVRKKAELNVFDDSEPKEGSPKTRRSNNEMQLTRSASSRNRGPRS
jgi:hypothetical protein